MSTRRGFLRRLAAGLVLCGALGGAGLLHQDDLAASAPGATAERVLSAHSPLSRAAHWHSAVFVKDDACLACQLQRFAGVAAEPCREAPLAAADFPATFTPTSLASAAVESHGSRGPPALL